MSFDLCLDWLNDAVVDKNETPSWFVFLECVNVLCLLPQQSLEALAWKKKSALSATTGKFKETVLYISKPWHFSTHFRKCLLLGGPDAWSSGAIRRVRRKPCSLTIHTGRFCFCCSSDLAPPTGTPCCLSGDHPLGMANISVQGCDFTRPHLQLLSCNMTLGI